MSDHSYEDDDWLSALSLDFECLVLECDAGKNDSFKQNSNNKHDWIKQPRMQKLQRCAAPEKQPAKIDADIDIIPNEFSEMLMEIDKRYKEARARGFALRALKQQPTEQERNDKQRSVQVDEMKRLIQNRWETQYNTIFNENKCSSSDDVLVWNHENDLETAKNASCFFIHVRAVH